MTTTDDLSWMLNDVLKVPGTHLAILASTDGLIRAHKTADRQESESSARDKADRIAAAMGGLYSVSRAIVDTFDTDDRWERSLIGTERGWIVVMAAGEGTALAVSAGQDVDMETLSFGMQRLVGRLEDAMKTPRRHDGPSQA